MSQGMTEVRTTKAHGNSYGEKYQKAPGDVYSLPSEHAALLVDQEIVERAKKDPPAK
jgi:hypothetical protein